MAGSFLFGGSMRALVRGMVAALIVAGTAVPQQQPAAAGTVVPQQQPAAAGVVLPQQQPAATADAIRPNDPGFARQWGLVKTRANDAWAATKGNGRVIVAVIDTGVSPVADLAGRLLPGRDFVNNDSNAADDNGHGTMAAGVIAAAGYDGKGVAGVCWNCRILPVKVLDAKGGGGYDKIAAGIRWAADQGASIISLSLGGSDDSPLLRDAVAYADGKGALVVAAAGNRGSSAAHYPGALPTVLAVGGVDQADKRYSWSNYGSWVDVTAPGCNAAQTRTGQIGDYCGTSSATPFLAGVAGLLASTDPAPTAAQIRTALIASKVRPSGRVDVLAAMNALPYSGDKTRPAVAFGSTASLVRGRTTVTAAAADQHGVARVQLLANGRLVAADTTAPYALPWRSAPFTGVVRLELRAVDRAGNVTSIRRYVRADNTAPTVRVAGNRKAVTVRAADPSGITRLELVVNGRITTSHRGYLRRFMVPAGARTVVVRAHDRAGNVRVVNGKLAG